MTFNYSEDQIVEIESEIESIEMTVEDFDRILTHFSTNFDRCYEKVVETVQSLCNYVSDALDQVKELFGRMTEDIQTVEVKQQYKVVKRLGNAKYYIYLKNNKIYRVRSNI